MSSITISDAKRKRILMAVGYPVFSLSDIVDDMLNEGDVDELFIWPAMQEYYEYNPIRNVQAYFTSGHFEIEFPNETTYGIANHKFLDSHSLGRTASPFMNSILFRNVTSNRSKYGTAYNYDLSIANVLEDSVKQTELHRTRSSKVNIDKRNRRITGYTNAGSKLEVTWAEFSLDWLDIPFEDESDVIKLAQSNTLQFFGDLRNQETGSLPVDLDGSDFINRAEDLRQEVIEKWQDRLKGVIIR